MHVAQLERSPRSGRCAGGCSTESARSISKDDLSGDRRIATRIENFEPCNLDDLGHLSYTVAMRSRLVAPGVPNGIPALIRMVSPGFANSSATAHRHACSTISATVETSGVCTECTPHTSASERAVPRLGVMLRIGGTGRSRAARRLVDPELG